MPGFLGNLALGVGASLVIWGLGACDFELNKKLAVCILSAIGGGSVLTSMLQKKEINFVNHKNNIMDDLVRSTVMQLKEMKEENKKSTSEKD